MILLFWVCTILLALAALSSLYGPWRAYGPSAVFVLVVVDLVILVLKVFGTPR